MEDRFELEWWGYLHVAGTVQVKRYFGHRDTGEARVSPFVARVVGPFMAKGREDALRIARERLGMGGLDAG